MIRIGLENCSRKFVRGSICRSVATVREGMESDKQFGLDLIILDVSSPSKNHIGHIKDLHAVFSATPILVFSNQMESFFAERVLRLGAKGYITENTAATNQLRLAIHKLLAGHVYIPEDTTEKMLLGMASPKNTPESPLHLLSEREVQVFEMIGEGRSIADVSNELGISRKTVGTHRSNIRKKICKQTAYELLEFAFLWAQSQSTDD